LKILKHVLILFVLLTDNGHSFDRVLFYGQELTLLTFDIILFSFVEALCESYLLAGCVTAVSCYMLGVCRKIGGRKNLAKKTLIDERFLI
jgi:meckelin